MAARTKLCACGTKIERATKRCLKCSREHLAAGAYSPAEQIAEDSQVQRSAKALTTLKAKYAEALQTIDRLEQQRGVATALSSGLDTFTIKPKHSSGTSEATAVFVLSDWHVEERVGAEIGGLNTYSMDIAEKRAIACFRNGLRCITILAQDVKISTVVLALLGDFISNDIHEEFLDTNETQPMHALVFAQNLLISGIQFLLDNSTYEFVVPCAVGNHSRTTKTTRFAVENGYSLEYMLYVHLAAYFREEPRVQFRIPAGMHNYVDIYDQVIRFQHGHAIKYAGGVGGIYIPVNKAIAQWNKARWADLDVFGHFHQLRDGGNFVCNGSLIGYNAFALSIKADHESPRQALFLVDKKRGRTFNCPVLVED